MKDGVGFIPEITRHKCPACSRGYVVHHTLHDIDDQGKLARCLLVKTKSNMAVSTIQYSTCTNRECMMHAELRTRRKEDADALFRRVQDVRHRGRWADNRPRRKTRRRKR